MILANLISGSKNKITLPPANANPAKVAKVDPVPAVFEPRLAGLATLALAEKKTTEIIKPTLARLATLADNSPTDIFAPDYLDSGTPAADGKDLPLYCESGDCHCSQKLPAADYPNGCGKCNYYGKPPADKQGLQNSVKVIEPATFEQTGDPVTCPYWFQVCHAVDFYQDACTRSTDCKIFKFLKVNT